MNRYIETDRLILREIEKKDAKDLYEIASNSKVNKYMLYSRYRNIEEVEEWISKVEGQSRKFVFQLKDIGKVIGIGSIKYKNDKNAHELEFTINENYWNQGFATEASKGLITWAIKVQDAKIIVTSHAEENIASGKVLKKCGFVPIGKSSYSTFDKEERFNLWIMNC